MKICLAIHSLSSGGMERVMSELTNCFSAKLNVQVHLLLFGRKPQFFYSIPGTVIIHKPAFEFDDSKRFWHTLRTLLFIRNCLKEIKPDTILGFGEYWNNLLLIASLGLGYPVYISDRSRPDKDLGFLQNLLRNRLYPFASGFIAQTGKAAEIAKKRNRNSQIRIIGNPIRQINSDPNIVRENIVLSIGGLIKTKNFDRLIRLFVHINLPGWKLVIVGGDAKKQNLMVELKKLIRFLGAEETVFLEGTRNDVEKYYRKSKIFAFTSNSEGFPNVIGEAMSAGLPVVSFDCIAGPSEMIKNDENGFLVPVYDYELFEIKLKQLMENEILREELGQNARKSITEFSTKKIGERFFSFITGD